MVRSDLVAGQAADGAAETLRPLAFLADRLALARGKLRQKLVITGIAVIEPVKLLAGAGQKADLFAQTRLGLGAEGDMGARKARLPRHLRHGLQQGRLHGRGLRDQPWPGHRGKGHRALQLGVIAPAGALIGLRPGVVKDVFALAVGLEIGGGDARHLPVQPRDQMAGMPARPLPDRARCLERRQKAVAGERVRARPGAIPFGGVEAGNLRQDGDGQFAHARQDRCPAALCQRPPVTSTFAPVT